MSRGSFWAPAAAALVAAAAALLLPLAWSDAEPLVWSEPLAVDRVVDGDTLVVTTPAGPDTVRLIGVDTPETVRPDTPVQCFGEEASAHMHQLLHGHDVLLAADPSQDDRDAYGRLLRYVQTTTGVDVNAELVAGGYAREYTHRTAYVQQTKYRQLELEAQRDGRGRWATC